MTAYIISQKAFVKILSSFCYSIHGGLDKMKEYKASNAGANLCIAAKCFLRGRGEPAHCDPCGIAQPTNNVPPCWPSSQLQLLLRLKIDNQRESCRESKGLLENSTAIFWFTLCTTIEKQVKSFIISVHTTIILLHNAMLRFCVIQNNYLVKM